MNIEQKRSITESTSENTFGAIFGPEPLHTKTTYKTHLLLCMPLENTTNSVAGNPHQKACAVFLIIQNGSSKLLIVSVTGNHIQDKYP